MKFRKTIELIAQELEEMNTKQIFISGQTGGNSSVKGELIVEKKDGDEDKGLNFLLYLAAFTLSPDVRDATLGDMEEVYRKDEKRFGTLRAKRILAVDISKTYLWIVLGVFRSRAVRLLKQLGLLSLWEYFRG